MPNLRNILNQQQAMKSRPTPSDFSAANFSVLDKFCALSGTSSMTYTLSATPSSFTLEIPYDLSFVPMALAFVSLDPLTTLLGGWEPMPRVAYGSGNIASIRQASAGSNLLTVTYNQIAAAPGGTFTDTYRYFLFQDQYKNE